MNTVPNAAMTVTEPGPHPSAPVAALPGHRPAGPDQRSSSASASPSRRAGTPRIWLLLGDKPGDNAQALALTNALGMSYAVKSLRPKPEWVLGKPRFRPGLDHLDAARSDPLAPPWPELVITIGRRPSMAALWLQQQSAIEQPDRPVKLVIIGRPKRWPDRFALIIAPAQFDVPPAPNVLQLDLPLLRPDPEALAAAAAAWSPTLERMPRPLTAVLVGGATKPYRFDEAVAYDLAASLEVMLRRDGGSLFVSTSRRTQPGVVDALREALPSDTRLFRWNAEAADANPYLGLLALADRFVVTGDSISMLVEVARLGKPLAIFPLPVRSDLATRLRLGLTRSLGTGGALARLGEQLRQRGLTGFGRDLGRIHDRLVERGLAVYLGAPFRTPEAPATDEIGRARDAVRALLG